MIQETLKSLDRTLNRIENKALIKTLNRTAFFVRAKLIDYTESKLGTKTNWHKRGPLAWKYKRAIPNHRVAYVYSRAEFWKKHQWDTWYQPDEGRVAIPTKLVPRTPKGRIRKPAYPGNLRKKVEIKTEKQDEILFGTIRKRKGARLLPLYLLRDKVFYRKRVSLDQVSQKEANETFPSLFEKEIKRAYRKG